jgi:hypothetical protein
LNTEQNEKHFRQKTHKFKIKQVMHIFQVVQHAITISEEHRFRMFENELRITSELKKGEVTGG